MSIFYVSFRNNTYLCITHAILHEVVLLARLHNCSSGSIAPLMSVHRASGQPVVGVAPLEALISFLHRRSYRKSGDGWVGLLVIRRSVLFLNNKVTLENLHINKDRIPSLCITHADIQSDRTREVNSCTIKKTPH